MRRGMDEVVQQGQTDENNKRTKGAWDSSYDPTYGAGMPEQGIIGDHNFATMQNDMNERRRQTACRMQSGSRSSRTFY